MPEINETAPRTAIYARVSTEEQREGQNIDSQVAELERFARDKAWPIVGIYKDEGWSGGVMERPELDRLRDAAQKRLLEVVLINDVDRLARDVAHLGVIKRDLEKNGVKVVFQKLPSDTSPTSNLMVNILGSFAEFERELISDRTRRGRRHKVEVRKQYLGCNTAYGLRYLRKDPITGKEGSLEIHPAEAAVVRRMFEWVDQDGLSARRVLNRLNESKIAPQKGAAVWGKSSVLRILRSETYAGVWHYNKFQSCEPNNPVLHGRYRKRAKCSVRQRAKGEWLPLLLPEPLTLVPRDRWERVQRQIDRNITFSPRNAKHLYLLQGLLRCGVCGARYTGDPCHGKFYYRCVARCKKLPSIRESAVNEAVKSAVRKVILNPELLLEPIRQLDQTQVREKAATRTATEQIDLELRKLAAEEGRILDAYRTSVITPVQLGEQLQKLKSRRGTLEAEKLADVPVEEPEPEKVNLAVTDYCAEAAKNLDGFTEEQWREFLRTIIQAVVFRGDSITIEGRIPLGDQQAKRLQLESPVVPLRHEETL